MCGCWQWEGGHWSSEGKVITDDGDQTAVFATSSFTVTSSSPSPHIQAPCSPPRSLLHASFSYSTACGFSPVSIFILWITTVASGWSLGLQRLPQPFSPSHSQTDLSGRQISCHSQCWWLPIALRMESKLGPLAHAPSPYKLPSFIYFVFSSSCLFFGNYSLPF